MDDRQTAFKEYVELVKKARKLEDEMLDIPRAAARKSNVKVDLLFTSQDKPKLLGKLKELKDIESKRYEALKKFRDML